MLAVRPPPPLALLRSSSPPIRTTRMALHNSFGIPQGLPASKRLESSASARRERWVRACTLQGRTPFSSGSDEAVESPSDGARRFYECINGKDMEALRAALAHDCVLEDSAFQSPFQGIKNVEGFLRDLIAAMGENVKFAIESTLEGSGSTAALVWHLEWKGKSIPFTRGCTFFEYETIKEELLIKRIRVVVDSPLKLGRSALELLRITTAVFDRFPQLANGLLQEPYTIIQHLMKIYKMFVEPLILPFILYYTHMWALLSAILKRIFKVLGISL